MKMQMRLKELGVEVRDLGRNNGGRSLFARRHFSPGEVIINDRSIIRSFKVTKMKKKEERNSAVKGRKEKGSREVS